MQEVVIGKSLICRKEKNLLLLVPVELRKEEIKTKTKTKKKTRVKGSVATVLNIYSSLSPWGRCEKPDNSHVCL